MIYNVVIALPVKHVRVVNIGEMEIRIMIPMNIPLLQYSGVEGVFYSIYHIGRSLRLGTILMWCTGKNVTKHLLGIIKGDKKTKDGLKARKDMKKLEINKKLWLVKD